MIERGMALTDNGNGFSTVREVASVRVKVWVALLVTVGVPLMTPFAVSVRPFGRGGEPALRAHV